MLTKCASDKIESQQKRALKTIYGFDRSYEELLVLTNLKTLEERREAAFINFTNKIVQTDRFGHLFPRREENQFDLRTPNIYREEFARTNRLYNSPLFRMRRYLNNN